MLTDATTLSLDTLPKDLFLDATIGINQFKSPQTAIIKLGKLRQVNKELKKKVEDCLISLVEQSAHMSTILIPSLKESSTAPSKTSEQLRKIILNEFPSLNEWKKLNIKKWMEANPKVTKSIEDGGHAQCIVYNNLSQPELFKIDYNTFLQYTNLIENRNFAFNVSECINSALCWDSFPNVIFSKDWVAICEQKNNEMCISVLDIESKDYLCDIDKIGDIIQIRCDDKFLYVLCKDLKKYKILIFDGKNWKLPPIQLISTEKEIRKFYLEQSKLIYITYDDSAKYQLSCINEIHSIKNTVPPVIVQASSQTNNPLIKTYDKDFFTITSVDKSSTALEKLKITPSKILNTCLITLPFKDSEILDFCIQFDKVFVLITQKKKVSLSCYDLIEGKFLKKFRFESIPTNFRLDLSPTLISEPGKGVKIVYTTQKDSFTKIAVTELDYS